MDYFILLLTYCIQSASVFMTSFGLVEVILPPSTFSPLIHIYFYVFCFEIWTLRFMGSKVFCGAAASFAALFLFDWKLLRSLNVAFAFCWESGDLLFDLNGRSESIDAICSAYLWSRFRGTLPGPRNILWRFCWIRLPGSASFEIWFSFLICFWSRAPVLTAASEWFSCWVNGPPFWPWKWVSGLLIYSFVEC